MERIGSTQIHQGHLFSLRRDRLRMADGRELERDVITHPGAVVVIAVQGDDLLLVRQYRHAAGEALLELVAGTLEPNEEPIVTAGRELQEEAGYRAKKLTPLGGFYSAPGFCTEYLHLYLAEDLTPSRLPGDADEEIELVRLSLSEAVQMALQGRLRDAKSLVGVLHYAELRRRS